MLTQDDYFHMLFEKVPGLYGSGVIPARFEDFKIKALYVDIILRYKPGLRGLSSKLVGE